MRYEQNKNFLHTLGTNYKVLAHVKRKGSALNLNLSNLPGQERLQSVFLFLEGNKTYKTHDFDMLSASQAVLHEEQTLLIPQKNMNTL